MSSLKALNGVFNKEFPWGTVLDDGSKKNLLKEKKLVTNYESCQGTMRVAFEILIQEKRQRKGYKTLKDLPFDWWNPVRFMTYGYQYQTAVSVSGLLNHKIDALLDGGAGINSVAEELVIACLNVCDMERVDISNPPLRGVGVRLLSLRSHPGKSLSPVSFQERETSSSWETWCSG